LSFFSTKLYRDHFESYMSGFGYSKLVQGRFEKMAFFLVDPLEERRRWTWRGRRRRMPRKGPSTSGGQSTWSRAWGYFGPAIDIQRKLGPGSCISSTHSAKGEEDEESPSTLIFFAAEAAGVAARQSHRATVRGGVGCLSTRMGLGPGQQMGRR